METDLSLAYNQQPCKKKDGGYVQFEKGSFRTRQGVYDHRRGSSTSEGNALTRIPSSSFRYSQKPNVAFTQHDVGRRVRYPACENSLSL